MTASGPSLVRPQQQGRAMPDDSALYEPELEKFVIGAIFNSQQPNQCYGIVAERLSESTFTLEKTRRVWAVMGSIVSRGLSIDYGTVLAELQRNNQLASVGSLIELQEGVPCLVDSHLLGMCSILQECAQRRKLSAELDTLQQRILQRDPIEEITTTGKAVISSIEGERETAKIEEIQSVHSFNSDGIEFAIDGLIACSAITGITGDAGVGKTTLITSGGGHVACGEDFLGRCCGQRKVLILDRENTLPVVQERLKRLRVPDGGDLKIWGGWLSTEVPEPDSPTVLQWVVRTQPKPLIIVDSFIAFLKGDENDSNTVRVFMQRLEGIKHFV